jgi:hypothetical protein
VRRVIANQTEEERASANERNRQRMAQIRAEEPDNLYICTDNGTTKNIVYPQAL